MDAEPKTKAVAKLLTPGFRSIKLYGDGRIESPWSSGSAVGAMARVDQAGSKRIFRDTRQAFLTIEGPELAISVKLATSSAGVSLARKFAAKVNQMAQQIGSTATSSATTSSDFIPDQISKLAGLRDQGILSEGGFEAKKTDLLARL